jgi:CelD/BcsL family acetyltransferase involved in cellulose biosynthesis
MRRLSAGDADPSVTQMSPNGLWHNLGHSGRIVIATQRHAKPRAVQRHLLFPPFVQLGAAPFLSRAVAVVMSNFAPSPLASPEGEALARKVADNAAAMEQRTPSRLAAALRVERLPGAEAFGALAPAWDDLHAQLSPRTPFTSALWNTLWWKHYRSDRLFVRDDLFVHAIRDGRGRLMAVAPMMLTQRPSVGPVRVRVLQCFGTDFNVTELRGLVCRPEDQADVITALSSHLGRTPDAWDWIDWGGLREDGTGCVALERAGALGLDRQTPGYHLVLAPTWEEFRARLARNIKESLRKCYNSLRRDGHEFTVRVVEAPSQVPAALETFFRLHAARGSATDTVRHADVFNQQRDRAFLLDYARTMAQRGQLRVFQLEIAGQVVATRIGFVLGDELYLYYSGYDLRWARYSVMTTVVAEAIKWAIGQRFKIVNLSTGHDTSKLRWGPQAVIYRSAKQIAPAPRSQLAYRAYHDILRMGRHDSQLGKLLTVARR